MEVIVGTMLNSLSQGLGMAVVWQPEMAQPLIYVFYVCLLAFMAVPDRQAICVLL